MGTLRALPSLRTGSAALPLAKVIEQTRQTKNSHLLFPMSAMPAFNLSTALVNKTHSISFPSQIFRCPV